MSKPRLAVYGLGAGSADDVSVGTLRRLRLSQSLGHPILLRTERHPSVTDLAAEGLVFARSFDSIYDTADTFEEVYGKIAAAVLETVKAIGSAAYLVPGHPLIGEKTVGLLLQHHEEIDIEIFSGLSFIDACLTANRRETTELVVIDGLSLPDTNDPYRKYPNPFVPASCHMIYQVYDRRIASNVKLALLERYSPDHAIQIISHAGRAAEQTVVTVDLHRLDHAENVFDHLTTLLIPPAVDAPYSGDFMALLDIMARLRHPETGCPWDREQTPKTLQRFAIEEVYEVIDAINDNDVEKYVEELGDLLLQVVFHAQLARERDDFTIEDVISAISEKLVRRHPHVFGNLAVSSSAEVLVNWETIKRAEKGNADRTSRLDGVPRQLPALALAQEVSKRAAKAGFEWDSLTGVLEKIDEELGELRQALADGNQLEVSSELGDLLFTVVNVARFAKIDAEDALRRMVKRFGNRFRTMEETASRPLEELQQAELEFLWLGAKAVEAQDHTDRETDRDRVN